MIEKELKLKVGIYKRAKKDLSYYEKEKANQVEKIHGMRAQPEKFDEYDIRKQEEVLQETEVMLPDSQTKVHEAKQELIMIMKQIPEDATWPCIQEAKELLESV